MFDPSTYYDEQMRRLTGGGTAASPRQAPAFAPLSDADEESALGSLGKKVLGGMGYVGGVLDKSFGGRAVRGLLGGKPRELLSILPGSDTLGLTDENDVVHGRDLLENAGIVDHSAPGSGMDLGDVAGFGLDVALDPSVYFGNWIGKLGQATGATAKLGQLAMKVPGAAKVYDTVAPIGRGVRALFDKSVENTTNPLMQESLSHMNTDVLPGKIAGIKDQLGGMAQRLRDAGELSPATSGVLRGSLENSYTGPLQPATSGVVDELRQMLGGMPAREQALGIDSKVIPDYAPRYKTVLDQVGGGGRREMGAFDPFDPSMIKRDRRLFGDMPTDRINELIQDPAVSGPNRTIQGQPGNLLQEQQHILSNYIDPTLPRATRLVQAAHLADWLSTMDPAYAEKGLDWFGNNIFSDVATRAVRGAQREAKTSALYDVLAKATQGVAAGPDSELLTDVLAKVPHLNQSDAQNILMQKMGLGPQQANQFFYNTFVPKDLAKDVARTIHAFNTPTALQPVLGAFDTITNLTKAAQTTLWPARYARNLLQQMWGMFVGGHADPRFGGLDPRQYLQPMLDAKSLVRDGGVLADANSIPGLTHLSPEDATKALQREMYAWDVAGPNKLVRDADRNGPGAMHAAQQQFAVPGDQQPGLGDILRSAIPQSKEELNPLGLQGVQGRMATTFAPAKAGHELDAMIDDMTRGGSYVALRRQGLAPAEAAREVTKIHYDYGNLSDFERGVVRRAVPFYSWLRQNLPAQMEQLIENPGGKTAQAIRAVNDAKQKEGFVPPDIAEGIGAPIGGREGDTQRYLTSLGLPFEDLGDLVTGHGLTGDIAQTAERQLANLNPLLKAPLELATGKQFMSGRDLHDLYGPTGDVGADQVLMNSPLSRFYTTGRTLLDERKNIGVKAANLLSPAKFTDVDMEKRKDIAAREMVTDLLQQYPQVHQFSEPWVKPEEAGTLDPEALGLMRLYKSLEQKAQERSRAEKKIGVKK
jgi:hypothetical protein